MRRQLLVFALLLALVNNGCTVTKYVPVKETEYITVRDTTVLRDTTIKYEIEKQVVRDYTGLLDTLRLETDFAKSTAFVDTTANLLKGTIENKPEKTIKIQWKEKTVYKDSIRTVEKPYPVEVEKRVKYVPWYAKFLSWVGALSLIAAILYILRKFHIF